MSINTIINTKRTWCRRCKISRALCFSCVCEHAYAEDECV